jgi:hypothetical protein
MREDQEIKRDRLDLGKVEIERVVGLNLGKHR